MKKLIVSLSLVAAMALPMLAAEKSEKPAEKAACCSKDKAACSMKDKEKCHGKASVKQAAASLKGAEVLKQ